MNNLLDALSINSLSKKIFYPLLELNKEIESISLDRHSTRSLFKIAISILSSIILMYYVFNNSKINETIKIIVELCNFSKENQPLIANVSSLVLCLNIGTVIGNLTTRCFCQIRYGDCEFYLTEKRLNFLEKKLQAQISNEITQQHIKDVVEFCIKNFHKENSSELGGKKEDWRKTIESLIYEADLEHFIDQQKALFLKKQQLEIKSLEILSRNYINLPSSSAKIPNYGSTNQSKNHIENQTLGHNFTLTNNNITERTIAPEQFNQSLEMNMASNNFNNFCHNCELSSIVNEKFAEYLRANQSNNNKNSLDELIKNYLKNLKVQSEITEQMLCLDGITKYLSLEYDPKPENILLHYNKTKEEANNNPSFNPKFSINSETFITPRNRCKNKAPN